MPAEGTAANGSVLPLLTDRELEYIKLVCRFPQPTVLEMAEHMGLSPKTVETHRAKAFHKLGVASPLELLHKAVVLGLVKCPCRWKEGAGVRTMT